MTFPWRADHKLTFPVNTHAKQENFLLRRFSPEQLFIQIKSHSHFIHALVDSVQGCPKVGSTLKFYQHLPWEIQGLFKMTISYTADIATCRYMGNFYKLLFRLVVLLPIWIKQVQLLIDCLMQMERKHLQGHMGRTFGLHNLFLPSKRLLPHLLDPWLRPEGVTTT